MWLYTFEVSQKRHCRLRCGGFSRQKAYKYFSSLSSCFPSSLHCTFVLFQKVHWRLGWSAKHRNSGCMTSVVRINLRTGMMMWRACCKLKLLFTLVIWENEAIQKDLKEDVCPLCQRRSTTTILQGAWVLSKGRKGFHYVSSTVRRSSSHLKGPRNETC